MGLFVGRVALTRKIGGRLVFDDGSTVFEARKGTSHIVAVVGPPGRDGGAKTVTAAEPLGGQRVVTVSGFHAEPSDVDVIAGSSKGAGARGAQVEFVDRGLMSDPAWSWTPGLPIFVGAMGVPTQVPPSSGVTRRIAWAISATEINIDLFPIVQLA